MKERIAATPPRGRRALRSSLFVTMLALAACGGSGESGESLVVASAEEGFSYDAGGLRQMVGDAAVVVLGEVESVESGRVVGEGEAALTFREVTLRVDEVLRGDFSGSQLVFEETGWEGSKPMVLNGYYPSAPGDRGIYFLYRKEAPPPEFTVLTHAQGRYLFRGGKTVGPDRSDPLVRRLERFSPDELRAAVKES